MRHQIRRPEGLRLPFLIVISVLVAGGLQASGAGQDRRAEALVDKAMAYVGDFVSRFSSVVAEEEYSQRLILERRNRQLKSDFLIVQIPGGLDWLSFRDVFEVDGKGVRDRDERLVKLFLEPPSDSLVRRASEISNASARYNFTGIGGLNDPLIALAFVQDRYRKQFRWTVVRNDKGVGPDVWSVRYEETVRPTILKGNANRDLPATGQIWIDEPTGRIMKTELRIERGGTAVGAGLVLRNRSDVTVTFQYDERFGIAVPVEMRENHFQGTNDVSATAKYGRFRRFGVTTEEKVN
jgi:hypothetical protein